MVMAHTVTDQALAAVLARAKRRGGEVSVAVEVVADDVSGHAVTLHVAVADPVPAARVLPSFAASDAPPVVVEAVVEAVPDEAGVTDGLEAVGKPEGV